MIEAFLANKASRYIVVLTAALVCLCAFWSRHAIYPFDDTFITFRYAYNLAHGFGLVWNPGGEHTEGYTNFLFVLVLSPFTLITKEIVPFSQAITIAATFATGVMLCELTARLLPVRVENKSVIGVAASIAYFIDPFVWINAFTGMETNVFVALVTATFLATLVGIERSRIWPAFVLATLAALTRPEGAILFPIIVVWSLREGIALKLLVYASLPTFILPLSIFAIWKLDYFGNLLPNSFYIKLAQPSDTRLGEEYVTQFFAHSKYLLLLTVVGIVLLRRQAFIWAIVSFSAMILGLYALSAPLEGVYWRFLMPVEAMMMSYSVMSVAALTANIRVQGVVLLAMLAFLGYHLHYGVTQRAANALEESNPMQMQYRRIAEFLSQVPNHSAMTFAWSDAGILPYYSGMRNIDLVGLNTNAIAHAKSTSAVRTFLINAKPDLLFIPVEHSQGTPRDSCIRVVGWGHGFIGEIYPTIPHDSAFYEYEPVGEFEQAPYDVLVLGRNTSESFEILKRNLFSASAQLAGFGRIPACFH